MTIYDSNIYLSCPPPYRIHVGEIFNSIFINRILIILIEKNQDGQYLYNGIFIFLKYIVRSISF